ncbi:MAG: Mor transcription activator family protein [Defluviitaleaceae bacterium]|nr:Mor transcription activator family protein [Defluviitaleaceae bacterium]
MERIQDNLSGFYKELAEIVSFETVVMIFEHFKGQQVTFPTRLMSTEFTIRQILKEYDGKNTKALAKKHNYSERWIRNIIKLHLSAEEDN